MVSAQSSSAAGGNPQALLAAPTRAAHPASRSTTLDESEASAAELAQRFASGDPAALAALYEQHSALVYSLARRALGNAQDAEDVTQQVFIAAWRGRAGYRPERGALGGWIVGIARHVILDTRTARTRRTDLERALTGQHVQVVRNSSKDECDQALNRVLVLQKLGLLSPVQRRLVGMAIYGDMTQAQISEETGLPLGTVKSHIRRALHALRRCMEQPA
ncbi:RNA polymerase sigma-70 factor (ECF subfamily) [Streptomyces sp. PvR006]|uniref:RNA polymerase sigma factor n=1 Tax=Streptomyces sp. PvR006 TaxID=2817860 RepID=UPI001AEA9158|nr:sigma-70 family RNA polymerase sigma factor [Streptomyces sp. PvR006]MBP2586142.1 RNA polymerase sigma-70 factor (ECF subfamily) [Streptomyces sp. PvR006]